MNIDFEMRKSYFRYRLLVMILSAYCITACDYGRTPSKIRFEKNCHINIPPDVKVLKDEYQGMVSNYVIYYTLKFPKNSLTKFTSDIRKSVYYNDTISVAYQNDTIWYKIPKGYRFHKHTGDKSFTDYDIYVDTASRVVSFEEISN